MSESPERILIIEDDPGIARLEQLRLSRAGYEVILASDAEQGRLVLQRGGIDLIVLDQNLQGEVSGLDLYEQLRSSGDDTPAILVTGLSDEKTLTRAIRGGLRDFVPKTADYFDDLPLAVQRVISQIRTQRKLAESEERLAGVIQLAEAIPQMVWSARPDGHVDYFNQRWIGYTGLTQQESEGRKWAIALHPDDLEPVGTSWSRSVTSGTIYNTEYRLRRASDGAYRWFLGRAVPVFDNSGQIMKWFGTCTDIDDQKRIEQELKRANALAESASRAKDQFLAMLSHELRTPLTPVLMLAVAARDDSKTPDHLRDTFEIIRQNLELEARLIDDLLDVMRIVRGKLPYQFEVVDAHAQIERAVEICRGDADSKGLQLTLELVANDHYVKADIARLQQILWNLIKNSVKFTPEGGKTLVRTRDEDKGLVIEVVDNGIGIDPEHLPNIFNAFEQGEDAVTRKFGGLGLGLAISRSIAEGHGGHLTAQSLGRGLGSTFILSLPTELPHHSEMRQADPILGDKSDGHEIRVLLVEDDVITSRIMAKLLRQNRYLVITANSIEAALRIPTEEYDLVVSDIGLPDGSGLDLMKSIKDRKDVPGIALTGYGMEEDILKSREAGFVAHLTKPLDYSKLEMMIRRVTHPDRLSSDL
ncbi:response regulator [Tundrisphaera lichenicola]|uniref:hybrid sensor histidine kinase/response regulator n=1 Tax=Tundrisphaera lichenicola TaxID=2029860 RepID=UPI003EBCB360